MDDLRTLAVKASRRAGMSFSAGLAALRLRALDLLNAVPAEEVYPREVKTVWFNVDTQPMTDEEIQKDFERQWKMISGWAAARRGVHLDGTEL